MKLKIRKKMPGYLVAGWFATSLASLAPPVIEIGKGGKGAWHLSVAIDTSFHNYVDGGFSCMRETRSVCDAAYRALLSIQPNADQVVPGLVSEFEEKRVLTDQSILMLCEYKSEAHAAKERLERFLAIEKPVLKKLAHLNFEWYEVENNPACLAACGLAMVDPHNPEIRNQTDTRAYIL